MAYRSRWKAEDKIRIVMEYLNNSISVAELCRKHGVVPNTFYNWREKFLEAGRLGLSGALAAQGRAPRVYARKLDS